MKKIQKQIFITSLSIFMVCFIPFILTSVFLVDSEGLPVFELPLMVEVIMGLSALHLVVFIYNQTKNQK